MKSDAVYSVVNDDLLRGRGGGDEGGFSEAYYVWLPMRTQNNVCTLNGCIKYDVMMELQHYFNRSKIRTTEYANQLSAVYEYPLMICAGFWRV
jgi:hypothetical protein